MYRWTLLIVLLGGASLRAELPSPRFDRIAPLGAAVGSTVEVEAVGGDLEEADKLFFDHPGIAATHVKDRKFKVSVAADVPPGTYDARLVAKWGVTSPRLFAASKGVTEVVEKDRTMNPRRLRS